MTASEAGTLCVGDKLGDATEPGRLGEVVEKRFFSVLVKWKDGILTQENFSSMARFIRKSPYLLKRKSRNVRP